MARTTFSNNARLELTTIPRGDAHGWARGCNKACGRVQMRTRPEIRRKLFLKALLPIVQSINLLSAPEYVPSVGAERMFSALLGEASPGSSTRSGRKSPTELVQGSSDRSEGHSERIAPIVLERGELAFSLNYAKKRIE